MLELISLVFSCLLISIQLNADSLPLGLRVVVSCEPHQIKKALQEKATSVEVALYFQTASGFSSMSIFNKCSLMSAARLLNPLCRLYDTDTKTWIKLLTTHIYCLINAPLWFCLL